MKGYVVRQGETPEGIAQALGIDYNALMSANKGGTDAHGKPLRQRVIGRDMQTRELMMSFLPVDWKEGVVLRLPNGYSGALGEIPSGAMGAPVNYWCWDHPEFKACMDGAFALAQSNCGYAFPVGTPEYDNCVEQAKTAGQVSCTDWCAQHFPNPPQPQQNEPEPSADPACNSVEYIKKVQAALGVKVDGLWGCESQKALDASGLVFENMVGNCTGTGPKKSGCYQGNVPPPTKKKKLGEPCKDGAECEAGLVCEDGKCAQPKQPEKTGGTPWLTYLGIGVALAAGAVGVAYVASNDDKKGGKKNPSRGLNNADREQWIDNDEGLYNWWKSSRQSKRDFIKDNKTEIDAGINRVLNAPPRQTQWYDR